MAQSRKNVTKKRKSVSLIGSAGVHYVCAVLNMNGLIALPTVRNTKGPDVVVLTENGDLSANLQVKTSSRKVSHWPIGNDYENWNGKNNYYVFVRYDAEQFEAFMASAEIVIQEVRSKQKEFRKRELKRWAPCWYLPHDKMKTKMQWRLFSRFRQLGNGKTRGQLVPRVHKGIK